MRCSRPSAGGPPIEQACAAEAFGIDRDPSGKRKFEFPPNIFHWNELDKGGHFAAFEQPVIFTQERRGCFRGVRLK
jgi:hypothetical protein